jgi:hypothetical protein
MVRSAIGVLARWRRKRCLCLKRITAASASAPRRQAEQAHVFRAGQLDRASIHYDAVESGRIEAAGGPGRSQTLNCRRQ